MEGMRASYCGVVTRQYPMGDTGNVWLSYTRLCSPPFSIRTARVERAGATRGRDRLSSPGGKRVGGESPYVLIGTVDQMMEDLQVRRKRWGISFYVVFEPYVDAFASVVARLASN